jgi:FKBP-type peptidyl-prolyl cis-trans isomerase
VLKLEEEKRELQEKVVKKQDEEEEKKEIPNPSNNPYKVLPSSLNYEIQAKIQGEQMQPR